MMVRFGTVGATLGEAPAPSSDGTLAVRRDLVDSLSANGAFASDEKLEFRGNVDV
jgi:hypothetical protein